MSDAAVITFQFQSTHPGWGATKINFRHLRQYSISIHAPRVGCDNRPTCIRWRDKHFNPRTPGGVRLLEQFELLRRVHISIHAPRVGCDGVRGVESCGNHISIHAPRVGCDAVYILSLIHILYVSDARKTASDKQKTAVRRPRLSGIRSKSVTAYVERNGYHRFVFGPF